MASPAVGNGNKTYDASYFARWYRQPRTRVHTPESIRRKVRMVVGIAEYFLRREIRTVLDIGAGEGTWRVELRRIRPNLRYRGVDPSTYVVQRFGKRRNITLGRFEDLPSLRLGGPFDLIVCADVMQYVNDTALPAGVTRISELLRGVAFLEAYTSGDEMEGDLEGWHQRTRESYLETFASAGLIGCGLHCYTTPALAERAVQLELR